MGNSSFYDLRTRTNGHYQTIKVKASSVAEAKRKAPHSSRVLSVEKAKKPFFSDPLSTSERQTLLRRVAMMTASGMPLSEALQLISDNFSGNISDIAAELRSKIETGDGIIQAMKDMPEHFPKKTILLIESVSESEGLTEGLKKGSDFENEISRSSEKLRNSVIFSYLQFSFGIGLIAASLFFIAPYSLDVMEKNASDTALMDKAIFGTQTALALFGSIALFGLVMFLVAKALKPLIPMFSDQLMLKLPVIRDVALSKESYSTFYAVSILLLSGARIKDSLDVVRDSIDAGVLSNDLRAASQKISVGESWAESFSSIDSTEVACFRVAQNKEDISKSFREVAESKKFMYQKNSALISKTLDILSLGAIITGAVTIYLISSIPGMEMMKLVG